MTKKMYSSTRENSPLARRPCGLITMLTIWISRFGKRLLQQQPEPQVLLLVDRDDEHRVVGVQQLLREQQPALHERQPLGVAVEVVALDVVVVVLPVLRAGVVRRVDVDAVDLAAVGEEQRLERVEVLGVDDGVERLVAAALDLAGRDQAGVDRVAELGDHDEVVQRRGLVCGLARRRRAALIRSGRAKGSNVAVPCERSIPTTRQSFSSAFLGI